MKKQKIKEEIEEYMKKNKFFCIENLKIRLYFFYDCKKTSNIKSLKTYFCKYKSF